MPDSRKMASIVLQVRLKALPGTESLGTRSRMSQWPDTVDMRDHLGGLYDQ